MSGDDATRPFRGLDARLVQDSPIPIRAELACAPGELLALVGPSGSGKSTILRMLAGLAAPREGRITVGGETWLDSAAGIDLPARQRRTGYVFQSYALFPHMTALENIAVALSDLPTAERGKRARALLGMVHLEGLEDRRPAALSGGQRQRVALARALARDPALLLLDEPFSAVDKATRLRLYREIAALRARLTMPSLLVTHDLEEAVMLADRLAVLAHGRILQTGTPENILTRPCCAAVARLVNLRNVFRGRIRALPEGKTPGLLDWQGLPLEFTHAPAGSAPGMDRQWVVPDGFVLLHRLDRPSRGEKENPVEGTISELVPIGQNVEVSLRPDHAPDLPLHFSVPTHVARRNALAVGRAARVSLLTEGIHLMEDGPTTP